MQKAPWLRDRASLRSLRTCKQRLALATPEIGEVLTIGKPRSNVPWWKGLK